MNIYWVMLRGKNIKVEFEDGESACGFFKNEYILTSSVEDAVLKAKNNVLVRIKKIPNIELLHDFSLEPEEVGIGAPIWKLIFKEGFIFYKFEDTED